jgi:spermidine synthase
MHRISALWKANIIVFISSFCVMVIELIAGRILAPYIGVSLYTWTSIIGVILAGIALGNYLGGRIADRYPSPLVLVAIFTAGGLLTIAVLPFTRMVALAEWLSNLPLMLNFTIKTFCIFFPPAVILSMASPLVIKLTLEDLGQTGGIVGTIYAFSTAGAILGTFMTGFYFILWFGVRMIVWLISAVLILAGATAWFSWKVPDRWRLSLRNVTVWAIILGVATTATVLFQFREAWQEDYTMESNYYSIKVSEDNDGTKVLILDRLVHSHVIIGEPTILKYDYLKIFEEIVRYFTRENQAPRVLHLGGGGYSFPRYMEAIYPESLNEVVEIDPAVTRVAYEELGLEPETSIKTYNQDARTFLIQRDRSTKYDIVVGDVFNDRSTPYHLTTLEFDRLVRTNMAPDGIYLVNIIDEHVSGRYLPAFVHTLRQVFEHVYLFPTAGGWENAVLNTYVIAATDHPIDITDYTRFTMTRPELKAPTSYPVGESEIDEYLAGRNPILLTDDYAPTDILILPLIK